LEVEVLDDHHIGRVRGAKDNTYTDGVICAKVARYAERVHHPDRLTEPLQRVGDKGAGEFRPISLAAALDEVAEAFVTAAARDGGEAVWPYHYAGTMGLVMRDGIKRLRHVMKYSGMHETICTPLAWSGYMAGTAKLAGVDPREMADSDLVVIWGTNPVHTQVNVMTHAVKARRNRGAKIVAIDVYRNATCKQADLALIVKPGTDAALACAVMHVLFRDGHADWDYLERYTDAPHELEAHLKTRDPAWASAICGVPVAEIEAFAKLIGEHKRCFFRLGYGFCRNRAGAVSMHAALCVPAVVGAWQYKGGGAFHNNGAIFQWNRTMIEGQDALDPTIRVLDQSRIGPILTGDAEALHGGPPVTAMLIQNTNPMMVAPDLARVHAGFARTDLFTCVHEQFLTDTARMADIVLPATMFLEHCDLYQGGGHQHILLGPKVIERLAGTVTNHEVICGLAERLGADHPGFRMTPEELIDWTLKASGWGDLATLREQRWLDVQPDFETAHFLNGFGRGFDAGDGKFRFRADWSKSRPHGFGPTGTPDSMPGLPDFWPVIDQATAERPFRLATSPARNYLNSSFTETPTSIKQERRPTALIHPEDAADLAVGDGDRVRLGNGQGSVVVHAKLFDGLRRGVVVVEGIWPNQAFEEGIGINLLTAAERIAPIGGAVYHDTAVWVEAA